MFQLEASHRNHVIPGAMLFLELCMKLQENHVPGRKPVTEITSFLELL